MAFNSNFVDEIKSKVNIVDVIGREVPLKAAAVADRIPCKYVQNSIK